jgi:steroid delta-isomerase-like uncharacterized protein
MTNDEIRAFVRRYVDYCEKGNARDLASCYTDNAHVDSPMFHDLDGRAAIEKSWADLFRAIGESRIQLDDIIIDNEAGARAVIVFTTSGMHRGMLFGVPATGRRVEVRGAFVMKFENGLIASELRVYDFVGMLVQLGVLKTKAV